MITSATKSLLGKSMTECHAAKIFDVNPNTYYKHLRKETEKEQKLAQKEKKRKLQNEEDNRIMGAIRDVVQKLWGFCPGARKMKVYLLHYHNIEISKNRCAGYLKRMNFIPSGTRTRDLTMDPYKGQAVPSNPGLALENLLESHFFLGPRRVILTDITYIPYLRGMNVAYHCVFYDPFVNQELGEYTSQKMDTDLIKGAYQDMLDRHGSEIAKNGPVLIHSDQGSQFTSTTFKRLLEDDEFIQSMSRRGTPTDNAPMEACFGRMKERVGNLLYNAKDFETVKATLTGFWASHNENEIYLCLAGLSPNNYIRYWKTGFYPMEKYYGIDKNHYYSPDEIIKKRQEEAEKERERNRKKYKKYKANLENLDNQLRLEAQSPLAKVMRDLERVQKQEKAVKECCEQLQERETMLKDLIQKIEKAIEFLSSATPDVIEELKDYKNWKKYEEMNYIPVKVALNI